MAWYDNILGRKVEDADDTYLKLNPVQQYLQEIILKQGRYLKLRKVLRRARNSKSWRKYDSG